MSRYNTFVLPKPVQKKLYLRISKELNCVDNYRQAVDDAVALFAPYFSQVEVLFTEEQSKIIEKLKNIRNVVSLDKEIKGNFNLNISRVYSLNTGKYLRHFEDQANKKVYNELVGNTIILYDHDIVSGKQFSDVEKHFNHKQTIVQPFVFVQANETTEEVLDLRDFLLDSHVLSYYNPNISAGLLMEDEQKIIASEFYWLCRVSYLHEAVDFEKRTSIPTLERNSLIEKFKEFKDKYKLRDY